MIEMSPFYAHESSVGPVFDVATWSRRKAWTMVIGALLFAACAVGGLVLAWKPTLLFAKPPTAITHFHKETLKLKNDHAWAAIFGTGLVAVAGWFGLAGAIASLINAAGENTYYFRVGPGGIALCVPHGLDISRLGLVFKRLEIQLPLDQIADWKVVQHRQLGAMSRHAGNTMAFFKLRTVDGKKEDFNLDCFREPARVIHGKINDALQMVPAQMNAAPTVTAENSAVTHIRSLEDKCAMILDALTNLVEGRNEHAAIVLRDAAGDRFVQFAKSRQKLLCDLRRQTLSPDETARAKQYFSGLVAGRAAGDGTNATPHHAGYSFQAELDQAEQATRVALEVFRDVYKLPDDFPLVVQPV